jgi:hypothetical protein
MAVLEAAVYPGRQLLVLGKIIPKIRPDTP